MFEHIIIKNGIDEYEKTSVAGLRCSKVTPITHPLVLDNFPSHICEYTRKRAHQLGIDLIFLPVGSPDLNPIEPVWKSLKWEASPLIVESAAEFHALVTDLFDHLTD